MPSLRYGRDITDDAAFLAKELSDARRLLDRRRMSAANRDAARQRLALIEDRIRAAYGRNGINRVETLAQYATPFDGEYTSEGRGAAGLQNTVNTRQPLPKAVNDMIRRMIKRGQIPEPTAYDENDSKSPISIRAPRAGAAPRGTRLAAAQQAQARQIGEKAVRDRNKRNARPNIATAKAAGVQVPKKAASKKKAAKKATPPRQPRRPRQA